MQTFSPQNWQSYQLIDCGNFEKLEQFGSYIIRRPEPQALWNKLLPQKEWNKLTQISFKQKGSHSGTWLNTNNLNTKWQLPYQTKHFKLTFNLSLTSFKHVGLFPEQAANWDYIFSQIKNLQVAEPKFLNLFAYTGGASLAAKAAGADVTHVDSVKQVISWSRENMESSGLDNIRWVVEDALKFVKREVKRGKNYHGIILDPPAYGIGASGERWQLEDNINEMLADVSKILNQDKHFLILNVYSLGLSALLIKNLVQYNFSKCNNLEFGELYLPAKSGVELPLGILARYKYGF
ncbi:MAG: class I SAM-dependent methyltransferase [Bacteroidia bacterium]